MKVEINTLNRSVYVQANEIAKDLETIDRWIASLRLARRWLRKEIKENAA